jgi:hypothetical protein
MNRAPAIQRSLAPIQKDLSEMKQLLQERNSKRKPSLHIVDRVRYHVLYTVKLDSFREKMPAHRTSISEMGNLLDAQTHSERRESIARLGSLVEAQEEGRRKEDEAEVGKRELLQILGERIGHDGDCESTNEVLQHLQRELVVKGGDEEEVNEQMKPFQNAMKLHLDGEGGLGVQGPERVQLERFKF